MAINSTVLLTFGIAEIAAGIAVPSTAALMVTVVILVAIGLVARQENKKYPPGPSRLDAANGFVFNGENLLAFKTKWRERFRPLYSLFIGRQRRVMLTDYDLIHDAFVRHADVCSLRPKGFGSLVSGSGKWPTAWN